MASKLFQYKEEILGLEEKGLNHNEIARRLKANHNLPQSEDTLRKGINRLIHSINSSNEGLLEECEANGLPIENVKQYWHKSKRYSIQVRGEVQDPLENYKKYVREIADALKGEFEWKTVNYTEQSEDNLFVPNIYDLHLGKLAWGEETGEDYDIKIAEARFNNALDDLITKASGYKFNRILFPVGNDIYNSDKAFPFSQTTSGTPQMDDSRWQKLFSTGHKMITQAIYKLAQIAPVDVVMVLSNHDLERVYYLGEVLSAVFANHPSVTIDNSPKVRKYYQYGKCLIATAHGHNEKPQDLPLIMAQEAPDKWADTWYREWLCGHLHHKKQLLTQTAKDYRGVHVTYLTSPSATDAWHYQKAFTGSIKGAEAFIYNKYEGKIGTVIHNIK